MSENKDVSVKSTVSEVHTWCLRNKRRCRQTAALSLVRFSKSHSDVCWWKFMEDVESILAATFQNENTRKNYLSKLRSVDRAVRGLPPARPSIPMTRRRSQKAKLREESSILFAEKTKDKKQAPAPVLNDSFPALAAVRSRLAVRRQVMDLLSSLSSAERNTTLMEILISVESNES